MHIEESKITAAIKDLRDQIKYSTRHHFAGSEYFQELPQNLKYRLTKSVLSEQYRTFHFFFRDYFHNFKASTGLMMQVVTQLKSNMYKPGDLIIEAG